MRMEVYIYSVQAKSLAGNYTSQRYNENKKTKAARYSARILEIYAFCWKIQQRASGPGENAAGVLVEGKAHSSWSIVVT